jgi:hypothetical protein
VKHSLRADGSGLQDCNVFSIERDDGPVTVVIEQRDQRRWVQAQASMTESHARISLAGAAGMFHFRGEP